MKYPELQNFEIVRKKIKNHFIRSQKLWPGNAQEMAEEFKNLPNFYQELRENSLSETALEEWFQSKTKNNETGKYCLGYKTDLEEGQST